MIDGPLVTRRLRSWWSAAWPLAALGIFASLALVRLLPAGYIRAVAAAPIVLLVPGSVSLGAIFEQRYRPRGISFCCYAALLSVIWTVLASLALNALRILIAVSSTYYCLLMACAVLAIGAQARLLLENPGTGRRAAVKAEAHDPDLSDAEASAAQAPQRPGRAGAYAAIAAVAGISLLWGGLYAYSHHRGPAPPGYTWIAWAGSPVTGANADGPGGVTLPFQIVHHQPDATEFELSAAWLGTPSHRLAAPRSFSIGPDHTVRGALYVPPLPDGCTYRLTVVLMAAHQVDPLTRRPETWSIYADVFDQGKSTKTCAK